MKIISIGSSCDVAFFIMKYFSSEYYPFDWLWSNIEFVIKTFETDSFDFARCEKLNAIWNPPNKHTYIFNNNCIGNQNRICSALSLHDADNHTESEYIAKISEINEKYKRRFKRLYDVLNSDEEIILVRLVLSKEQGAIKKVYDTTEKINYLSKLLSKKFKAKISIYLVDTDNFINKNNLTDNVYVFKSLKHLNSHLFINVDNRYKNIYANNIKCIFGIILVILWLIIGYPFILNLKDVLKYKHNIMKTER